MRCPGDYNDYEQLISQPKARDFRCAETSQPGKIPVTRGGMAWALTLFSLILLVLLTIFIVQNQEGMTIAFIGIERSMASGTALLIAAVGGGLLVGTVGTARILQLRFPHRP